jgi:hypothetical protein
MENTNDSVFDCVMTQCHAALCLAQKEARRANSGAVTQRQISTTRADHEIVRRLRTSISGRSGQWNFISTYLQSEGLEL